MDAFVGMELAARSSMEGKEYWVHLDAEGPLEKYPAKQHVRRVQTKLGVDEGLIYLAGQPAKNNEDSDMPAPFRQRRYFYYLTGCNEPSCHMTYDIQHDILSLFIPRIDPRRVIWNGRGSTLAEALEKYDVDEVYYIDELDDSIKEWNNYYGGHGSNFYVLHNGQLPRIPGLHVVIDSETLQPAMNAARMIKDDHEIRLIREANDISSEAHKKVLSNILSYTNEAQVEGLFMDVCISRQAKQQAYDPIAASGSNAGTLHYDANNENFEDRQLMCLDAGCEYGLYASDITRTFPLTDSWPSKEAENIYKLVERMQESCIERLAPGVRYLDLHILAHQIAIDGLLKLGILHNGTREEIYAAGTSRAFFPHGLGHHIGLEVHDVGQAELMSVRRGKAVTVQVPSLFPENFHLPVFDAALCHAPTDTQSSQLEEGMVVTVEPGIYFSIYALQHFYLPSPIHSRFINQTVLQRYMPVGGVRIEDDILITSRGYENLTTAPKGDAMFDVIRGHGSSLTMTTQPLAIPHANAFELPLSRAPGCPLQTTLHTTQPPKRAATIPYQAGAGHPNERAHTLNLRRSMTTDERVRHWRQTCEQQMSRRPSSDKGVSTSICGSSSSNVRHTFLSGGPERPTPARIQPECSDCFILVQTLSRLRQNLTMSKQKSQQHSNQLWNPPAEPSRRCPLEYPTDEVAQQPEGTARERLPAAKERLHDAPRMWTEDTVTPRTSVTRPQGRLDDQEPEQFYRNHVLPTPARVTTGMIQQQYPSQTASVHSSDHSRYPTMRPQSSMPIRMRTAPMQEHRRPSNHTDDCDWLA